MRHGQATFLHENLGPPVLRFENEDIGIVIEQARGDLLLNWMMCSL